MLPYLSLEIHYMMLETISTSTDAPVFSDFWPYGETFFKHPTGRPCDGRLIPDFIAEYANLPLIPPYLQPGNNQFMEGENLEAKGDRVLAENLQGMVISSEIQEHVQSSNHQFVNGVNFASSGAGALVETHQGWVCQEYKVYCLRYVP
ncbi:hypothetical protein OIU77_001343 [Salix suchowensis]|uniref:Uncharacterized protein n=1 Tax=Salix suchowensis TaxID=1278906 RepID=A0ABQ9B440_9ROSI|nr:hypothetical protein OIU77_001343 [Salix suchowensis]